MQLPTSTPSPSPTLQPILHRPALVTGGHGVPVKIMRYNDCLSEKDFTHGCNSPPISPSPTLQPLPHPLTFAKGATVFSGEDHAL